MLDGFRFDELPSGEIRVHYGAMMGWATFDSMADAKAEALPWLDKQEEKLHKMLADIAAIRKIALKN